jgi:hypothetical protein
MNVINSTLLGIEIVLVVIAAELAVLTGVYVSRRR